MIFVVECDFYISQDCFMRDLWDVFIQSFSEQAYFLDASSFSINFSFGCILEEYSEVRVRTLSQNKIYDISFYKSTPETVQFQQAQLPSMQRSLYDNYDLQSRISSQKHMWRLRGDPPRQLIVSD